MATFRYDPAIATAPAPSPASETCVQTCPDCGGLECLCRPRFFAGQLLTDEDLGRLDHYITAKSKLHNRYLVGWGVVCGLEVVCSPCDGQVAVRAGYALSPCGEDIVVCADTLVDVCSLIQKCRKVIRQDCQPAQPGVPDPCAEATENWILSIHYDEKPSRGVVPLKNAGGAACCSRCACGGSSSCGCRCHGNGSGNGNGKATSKCGMKPGAAPTAAQCEPTILCEGYRFAVTKAPPAQKGKQDYGALMDRFLECFQALKGLIAPPPASQDPTEVQKWCCAIRDNLVDFFAANPGYDCTVPQQLATMCQSTDVQTILGNVVRILAEYVRDCLCSALLPPCSKQVADARVPLATLVVRKKDCQILGICNLDVRKFVTSFPNLAYWLSMFPYVRNLRTLISKLCCQSLERRQVVYGQPRTAYRMAAVPPPPSTASQEVGAVAVQAWANRKKVVDVQTLSAAALGLSDEKGQPFLTEVEQSHPLETMVFNQLAVPLVEAMLPPQVAGVMGAAAGVAAAPAPDTGAQIADLKMQLQKLQDEFKRSQEHITELSKQIKKK